MTELDDIMARLAVVRVYAEAVTAIHAAERFESLAARDSAPQWAHESRAEAEGFWLADEADERRRR